MRFYPKFCLSFTLFQENTPLLQYWIERSAPMYQRAAFRGPLVSLFLSKISVSLKSNVPFVIS